jgi:hypothetical protein
MKFCAPVDVLKLGLVSLLTDLSSEMNFSVFAVVFTTVAGPSAALLGAAAPDAPDDVSRSIRPAQQAACSGDACASGCGRR